MTTERGLMTGRTMRRMAWGTTAAVVLLGAVSTGAQAQRTRRQNTIEIRGTVPTPQVVTVRPREVPSYSRQVLVPRFYDHDFWPDIQEGYSVMSNRLITIDTMALGVDSVGVPDFFRLPSVRMPEPLRAKFAYLRKQYEWCAPNWWCPSHRVRVQVSADSAALFDMRLPPQPVAPVSRPGAPRPTINPDSLPQVQQRWCSPHWWCPPGGVITTPRPTTPSDTTRRPPPAAPPADGTPLAVRADSMRPGSSAGTSSALHRR